MTQRSPAPSNEDAIRKLVDRFLGWGLPKDFSPDCGISFKPSDHPNQWPVGTNLFTADQAQKMFEYVLQDALACPRPLVMGEHACRNRKQCWEPCGDLGHHEEYARTVPSETAPPIQAHSKTEFKRLTAMGANVSHADAIKHAANCGMEALLKMALAKAEELDLLHACNAPEVAKDAERYRWLRDSCGDTEPPDGIGFISRGIHWQAFGAEGKATTFDAAIDTAMQAERTP